VVHDCVSTVLLRLHCDLLCFKHTVCGPCILSARRCWFFMRMWTWQHTFFSVIPAAVEFIFMCSCEVVHSFLRHVCDSVRTRLGAPTCTQTHTNEQTTHRHSRRNGFKCSWPISALSVGSFPYGGIVLTTPECVKHVLKDAFEKYEKTSECSGWRRRGSPRPCLASHCQL
jgi:hypothetical protein